MNVVEDVVAFTTKDIVEICNGKLLSGNENIVVEEFSKDTRTIKSTEIYVAIKGEIFNGHQFVEDSFKKGAIGCIIEEEISEEILKKYADKVVIKVENSIKALQDLAKYKREQYDIPVIAVTGSAGKTSTKDMISSVLGSKYKVLKSEGNFNNDIGLPLTLLKLKDHTAVVIEMGMNHSGEIRRLTNIAKPTIAVITNIGTSHIGYLGSRENILKAKLEILEGLKENGIVIINNDNDLLNKFNKENKTYNVITCGIEEKSDFYGYNINVTEKESTYEIDINNIKKEVTLFSVGKHYIYNSLIAIAIGNTLKIDINNIIENLKCFKLTGMRMNVKVTKSNILVIDDTYNASYESMKYAIEYLGSIRTRNRIAILGNMAELGDYSEELHRKVGEEIFKNNIDILITVGENAKYISKETKELKKDDSNIYECDNYEQAINILDKVLIKEDAVLIKGSRIMKLEEIVKRLFKGEF